MIFRGTDPQKENQLLFRMGAAKMQASRGNRTAIVRAFFVLLVGCSRFLRVIPGQIWVFAKARSVGWIPHEVHEETGQVNAAKLQAVKPARDALRLAGGMVRGRGVYGSRCKDFDKPQRTGYVKSIFKARPGFTHHQP